MIAHLVAAAFLATVLWPMTSASAADRIAFGTTQAGGSHYVYCVAATKAINSLASDKVDVTVIGTAGGIDNLVRIDRGQLNMALAGFELIYQRYHGIGRFEGQPAPKLRILWAYSASALFFVVREDSGVASFRELTGKKFTAGSRGSGGEALVKQMFAAIDVKPDYVAATLTDAIDAIKDGRSVGYAKAGGGLSLDGSTMELKALTPIRVLGFAPDEVQRLRHELPYLSFTTLKGDKSQGIPPITTLIQAIGIFAYEDSVTDDQVAAILRGVVDGHEIQAAAYPDVRGVDIAQKTIEAAAAAGLPLHRGAVKFLRDRGYEIPKSIMPPDAK